MTDLLERLAAGNPTPETEQPPIEDLWRKLSALDAGTPRGREGHWFRRAGRIGRAVPAVIAVVVPVVVVAAIAVPLLRIHHTTPHPAPTGATHGRLALDPQPSESRLSNSPVARVPSWCSTREPARSR